MSVDLFLGFVSEFLKVVSAIMFLVFGVGMLVVCFLATKLFIDVLRGKVKL